MSLLEPFTKPRWQHRDPEVRLAAVGDLVDEDTLLEVLQLDEDMTVRGCALARISTAATLDGLIDQPPAWLNDELLRQARAQRLGQLLDADGALPPAADDRLLLRITALTDDTDLLQAAIGQIASAETRLDLAVSHPQAQGRLTAAQSISDIDLLQGLMQATKHKDKAVYRHCRERIDEHLVAERAVAEREENLARLAESAAALRQSVNSPEYRARFRGLQQRWAELREFAAPELREAIEADLDVCAKRIERLELEQAETRRAAERVAAAAESFEGLLAELEGLDSGLLNAEGAPAELEARLNQVEERWVAAMREAAPEPTQTEHCKAQLSRWRVALQTRARLDSRGAELERLFKSADKLDRADFKSVHKALQATTKVIKTLPWPEEFADVTPAQLARLRDQQAGLSKRLAELEQKAEKTLAKVQAGFEAFRAELATNHFRNADRALNKLRSQLRQLPSARQGPFEQELRPLLARLREIHDWQGFAIEPKKRELIEKMQALVGSEDDADTLAARIKALQKEWKQLGPLAPEQDQALWRSFHEAADQAWAPCKEAFEARAEARKQVYHQRMQLVAQLREYEQGIAWPDLENPDPEQPAPDWKMVRKTLTAARKAFRELVPVDRKQERKSQKALDKVCNRIFAHLEKEYARNLERKQALVVEAQGLAAMEDLRQAIDRAKAIQREWKEVGLTPQRVDRQLWKDFRKACDAVFARLGQERDQRNADARARTQKRKADEQARAEQAAERKRQKQERWQRLLDRMQACALKPDDPDKAAGLWGEDDSLPKGIDAEALQAWWDNGPGDAEADIVRHTCIALEVLAGVDSPPEEKQARMAYQMKRLVEGMGSGPGDSRERLAEAINAFVVTRPGAEWVGRFCAGVEAARNGPSKL